MSETAAYLVDHVIPSVPVRQWVLALPIALRVLLARFSGEPKHSFALPCAGRRVPN